MSENMDNRKYTALCGLYCRDCIPGDERLYALVEALLEELASTGFRNYAELKAKRSAVLGEFPTAEAVLRESGPSLQLERRVTHIHVRRPRAPNVCEPGGA